MRARDGSQPFGAVLPSCRVQVLILSPTRELACQTEKVILAIGEYMNVQAHACIGGKSLGELDTEVKADAQVASPCTKSSCTLAIRQRTKQLAM